jgi:hypothetical protein
VKKLNKIVSLLKEDVTVKRYIELRNIILANEELSRLVKSDLSLNEAKIDSFDLKDIVLEYFEIEKIVKNDLEMISTIINEAININFLV